MIYKNNSIQALIFDMDGTLVDSSEALLRLFKRILNEVGEEVSREEIMKYGGAKFNEWLEKLLPKSKKDLLESEGKDKSYWMNLYIKEFIGYIKVINGAEEVLEDLNEDYKLALVTNTPKKIACRILKKLKVKKYFDVILGEGDFERSKPDPQPLLMVLERLNLNKGEVIYVGDTKYDKKAGKRAKIQTLIFGEEIQHLKEIKKFI